MTSEEPEYPRSPRIHRILTDPNPPAVAETFVLTIEGEHFDENTGIEISHQYSNWASPQSTGLIPDYKTCAIIKHPDKLTHALIKANVLIINGPGEYIVHVMKYTGKTIGERIGESKRLQVYSLEVAKEMRRMVPGALTSQQDTEKKDNIFCKKGDRWEIAYEESEPFYPNNYIGLHYIKHLLLQPHKEFDVLKFVREVERVSVSSAGVRNKIDEGLSISTSPGKGGEVIDQKAKAAYVRELNEYDKEIQKAERDGDEVLLGQLQKEKENLKSHLSSVIGHGGSTRRFDDEKERARKAVSASINRALEAIKKYNQELYEHLDKYITRGSTLSYKPPKPISWN